MDYIRIGQKLYYKNKFTGEIEYVVVLALGQYSFKFRLPDGRVSSVDYSAIGPRLIPVSDTYNLPRCGLHSWEISKLSWYETHSRVHPLVDDVAMEKALSKPLSKRPCHCCAMYEQGSCDGFIQWCDSFVPSHDYYKEADELSLEFEHMYG